MNKWIFFGLFFFSACAADPPPSGAWDEAVNDFGLYIEEAIREDFPDDNLAELALRFALQHPAVSSVIAGMRNPRQVEMNVPVADLPPLSDEQMEKLSKHAWLKYSLFNYAPSSP